MAQAYFLLRPHFLLSFTIRLIFHMCWTVFFFSLCVCVAFFCLIGSFSMAEQYICNKFWHKNLNGYCNKCYAPEDNLRDKAYWDKWMYYWLCWGLGWLKPYHISPLCLQWQVTGWPLPLHASTKNIFYVTLYSTFKNNHFHHTQLIRPKLWTSINVSLSMVTHSDIWKAERKQRPSQLNVF